MKLELARAMLYKADLLMLDEPTNHVSIRIRVWFCHASKGYIVKTGVMTWVVLEQSRAGGVGQRWVDDRGLAALC